MDINFIHDRQHDFEGKALTKGGTTIAWQLNSEAREIRVALAFCSEKDVYNRKVGRKQAVERLETGQYAKFSENDVLNFAVEQLVPRIFRDASTVVDFQLEEFSTGWLQNFIDYRRQEIWDQLLENKHAPVYYTKPVVESEDDTAERSDA